VQIKHVIVGVLIGTSALGLMLHRLTKKEPAANDQPLTPKAVHIVLHHVKTRKAASSRKSLVLQNHNRTSVSVLSSKKLYGRSDE
jgi:hypothetical protein